MEEGVENRNIRKFARRLSLLDITGKVDSGDMTASRDFLRESFSSSYGGDYSSRYLEVPR